MARDQLSDKEIFSFARRLDSSEAVSEYLDQVCGSDVSRRERVLELVKADKGDSFLENPAVPLPETAESESPGRRDEMIGLYKLREQIGEGGMGVVYVAEQESPLRRKVALKIIKPGMDTKSVVARFEAERQTLAVMDHANIARVYDAGSTEGGLPYFVMELVNGIAITQYCDAHELSIRERLELFKDICNAIQHAHQKGVIHRDIKPSNVLVTEQDGKAVAKVIDFGVAKAIGHQSITNRSIYTSFRAVIGTPLYMSPEQAALSNIDVDTRSDVYSLGVLLYELLTGTTPFDKETFQTAAQDEVLRMIREKDPPKPSTRIGTLGGKTPAVSKARKTDIASLGRTIRGELDWIVMKALEKDRIRRYDTAKGFSLDIDRFLSDEPVSACPPSRLYSLGKIARRNKGLVITATAVFFSLTIGLVAIGVSNWKTNWALTREAVALKDANLARDQLQRTNTELRTSNNTFAIEAAFRAWEIGSLDRLKVLLEQYQPENPNEEGNRQFEWRLLKQFLADSFPANTYKCDAVVIDLAFVGNESILVGALGNGKLFFKNLESGKDGHLLSSHLIGKPGFRMSRVAALDQRRFVTCGGNHRKMQAGENPYGNIMLWEVGAGGESANLVKEFPFSQPIDWLAVRSPEVVLYSPFDSDITHEFSLATGKSDEKRVFKGSNASISPSGKLIATSTNAEFSQYDSVTVFEVESGRELVSCPTASQTRAMSFSNDESTLFGSDSSGTWMIHINSASELMETDRITWRRSFDTLPLQKRSWLAVSGSDDGTLRIYDYSRRSEIAKLLHANRVYRLDSSSDGKLLASCSQDQTIKLWSLDRVANRFHRGYPHWFSALGLSSGGEYYAFCRDPSTITICSSRDSSTKNVSFSQGVGTLKGFAFAPMDRFLAAAIGNQVHVMNLQTNEEQIIATSGRSWAVTFSANGNDLVVGSDNEVVNIDLSSGKRTTLWQRLGSYFEETRFSPDGRYLACGAYFPKQAFPGHDGMNYARVWDMQSDDQPYFDLPYPRGIQCLSFSPDARYLAIAGLADVVKIYDLQTRDNVATLAGNGSWLTSAEFSLDGGTIATASPAGEIRFWRFPSCAPSGSMFVGRGLRRIKFGGDGNSLIWSSMDGDVGFYMASPLN